MMITEWWAFEVLAVESGLLKDPQISLGAHTIMFHFCTFTFMFYLGASASACSCSHVIRRFARTGIADATSVRVGNFVASRQPLGAKTSCLMGVAASAVLSFAIGGLIIGLRDYVPVPFAYDVQVRDMASTVAVSVGCFQVRAQRFAPCLCLWPSMN